MAGTASGVRLAGFPVGNPDFKSNNKQETATDL